MATPTKLNSIEIQHIATALELAITSAQRAAKSAASEEIRQAFENRAKALKAVAVKVTQTEFTL